MVIMAMHEYMIANTMLMIVLLEMIEQTAPSECKCHSHGRRYISTKDANATINHAR
jgi:hypothetical protein